ncbi:MAG: dTDP-4-dehydrorhamnose reductase [Acidobacteriota bacterium]|nr:dTDP-4-dehydrorhamnose reductase [Acidobacteriota bacterium]
MSRRPRILIVGATGQLGRELRRSFAPVGEIVAVHRQTADLTVPEQLRALVRRAAPDVILNAAAYTAVDRAESEPELAMAVNAQAPGTLAEEALRARALLVHYSTDYVFDGSKTGPWEETDTPNPLNVYGASKLAGEQAIRAAGGRHLIFRTSWVYGPHGNNFLLTMLRLGRERRELSVVNDQFGSPTSSIELADATQAIVSRILSGQYGSADGWSGTYHMTCSGSVSWYGFARAIFARAQRLFDGKVPLVKPIPSSEYPTAALRPRNSVLSNEKLLAQFGMQLAPWESALDEVMQVLVMAKARA